VGMSPAIATMAAMMLLSPTAQQTTRKVTAWSQHGDRTAVHNVQTRCTKFSKPTLTLLTPPSYVQS
jgi:hypothetical protein